MIASWIKTFWRDQAALTQAIALKQDDEVARLDAGLAALRHAIVEAKGLDPFERRLQMVFLLDLIRFHAEDPHLVVESAGDLERLLLKRDAPCEAGLSPAHNPVGGIRLSSFKPALLRL